MEIRYLDSSKASNDVRDEFKKLQNEIENLIRTIEPNVKFTLQHGPTYILISGPEFFQFRVSFRVVNTELRPQYHLDFFYQTDLNKDYRSLNKKFEFDLISHGQIGWVSMDTEKRSVTTKELSEIIFKYCMDLYSNPP